MRAVIQRVSKASVTIENKIFSSIENGFMILLGIEDTDTQEDIDWLAKKIVKMRIFPDENGLMNKDLSSHKGKLLIISQFTLFAMTKKGNRPSFIKASKPDKSKPIYEQFCKKTEELVGKENVKRGIFGADMSVSITNEGPTTIIIDTKNKE